jgi:hypothetical protein
MDGTLRKPWKKPTGLAWRIRQDWWNLHESTSRPERQNSRFEKDSRMCHGLSAFRILSRLLIVCGSFISSVQTLATSQVTGIDIHVTSTSGDPIEGVLVIPGGGFWLPITDKTGLFHLEVLQISSPFVTRDINPYCFGNEEGSILALGRSTSVICSRI